MKQFILSFSFIFFSVFAFCQTVADYFPASKGNQWWYINSKNEAADIRICVTNQPTNNRAAIVCDIYNDWNGFITITRYLITPQSVQKIAFAGPGKTNFEPINPTSIEFSLPGNEWREDAGGGEYYLCKSSRINFTFEEQTLDCVVIERRIFVETNRLLMTKRQYYARGIGLIQETIQGPGQAEEVFIRLSDCSIN